MRRARRGGNADDNEMPGDELERPSKSALKREMTALQELGEALVALSDGDLATIPLDEKLLDAIMTARRITSHEGRRRQMQYIGKLMRATDVEPIVAAHNELLNGRQQRNRAFHELEALRDRLIAEGTAAMGDVLARWPEVDRQHLRQLIVAAVAERDQNRPPAAGRKLFRYLRELAEL